MKDAFGYSSPQNVTSEGDIRVEFTGKNLTKFGGIQLVRKFLGHLRVKEELESAVPFEKRDRKFSVGGMLVCLLYAVILDFKRQSDTLMLRLDKVFQKIAGLDDYPTQSTISRFLKSFRVETAKGIANVENMIKEGIMAYSLDVNISHFYGANIAHFHLVMLAYNLMNLFK